MKKWSAHMLTGIEKMTSKMRAAGTCLTDEYGPSCRREASRMAIVLMLAGAVVLFSGALQPAMAVSRNYQLQVPNVDCDTSTDTYPNPFYGNMVDDGTQECNRNDEIDSSINASSTETVFATTKSSVEATDIFITGESLQIVLDNYTNSGTDGIGHFDLLSCSQVNCNGGAVVQVGTTTFDLPDNTATTNPNISGLAGYVDAGNYLGFRLRIQNDDTGGRDDYLSEFGETSRADRDIRIKVIEETACTAVQPAGLTATLNTSPYRGDLSWTTSCTDTDHYIIYRDGDYIGETVGCTGTYVDYTIQPNSSYNYELYGWSDANSCQSNMPDSAPLTTGNCSDPTNSNLTIQTPSAGATLSNSVPVTVRINSNGGTNYGLLEIGLDGTYYTATDGNNDLDWDYTFDTKVRLPRSIDYPVGATISARGYDPDCNVIKTVSQSNTIDNTCKREASVTLDRIVGYAAQGQTASYVVTVVNNAAAGCGDTDYSFSVVSNSDTTNFDQFTFTTSPITLAPQASGTTTLQIRADAAGTEWSVNTTEFSIGNNTGQPSPANQTVTTTLFDADLKIHNSVTTESTKHGGKWGTSQTGAKYGNFRCDTCHLAGTGNIKRFRTTIAAPNSDPLPGESKSATINFLSMSDFGDDSSVHVDPATTMACQYCHTYDDLQEVGVKFHAYSMPATASHNNATDCIQCHPHNKGFKPSCTACHNDGTDDGSREHAIDINASVDLHNRHLQSLVCADCHGTGADDGSHSGHREGGSVVDPAKVTFDTSIITVWDGATKDCTNTCHTATDTQVTWNDATTIVDFYTSGSCTDCHSVGNVGAVVTVGSQHVDADGADLDGGGDLPSGDCTHCHPSGADTHKKSSPTDNVAVIPNNSTVGINYSHTVYESTQGVVLGGTQTKNFAGAPANEAEICWDCHDMSGDGVLREADNDINEFESGLSTAYNFGTLSTSSWVGASWTSDVGVFGYKTSGIQSTHAVDGGASGPGLDPVAAIRCSYCHDVHNGTNGDGSTAGAPLLRGTWKGNPYKEDGAPQAGTNFTAIDEYDNVPRGGTGYVQYGGYFIDQNSGHPTTGGIAWGVATDADVAAAGWDNAKSAGLCLMCHINATVTSIDDMNQFGNPADDWVGTNGHSAAVIGGTSNKAVNIFTTAIRNARDGVGLDPNNVAGDNGRPPMGYVGVDRGYGFRSETGEGQGWDYQPEVAGGTQSQPYTYQLYSWGADTATGLDSNYHRFPCSKCHNPHASRLPRLMITNCLDTNHNTWDTQAGVESIVPGVNSDNGDGPPSADNTWVTGDPAEAQNGTGGAALPFSQATSAQNCHRQKDLRYTNPGGDGWNTVTPWQEF